MKKKKSDPVLIILVDAEICIVWIGVFVLLYFTPIFFARDKSENYWTDVYYTEAVEDYYISLAVYGGPTSEDAFQVDLIGFTGDVEVRSYSNDSFTIDVTNLEDTDRSITKKIIRVTITTDAGSETLSQSFKLLTAQQFVWKSVVRLLLIIAAFIAIIAIVGRLRFHQRLFFCLYLISFLPIATSIIEDNIRYTGASSRLIFIGLTCFYILLFAAALHFAKSLFGRAYPIVLILLSTYLLFQLSSLFTAFYEMDYPNEAYKGIIAFDEELVDVTLTARQRLRGLYSFQFFFGFPTGKMYGVVAVFQFIVGKLYEVVLFGGIADYIAKLVVKKTK